MTILVTGAAGFIGMHVVRALLDRGQRVIGVDNFNDYYDIRLKEARIVHLGIAPAFSLERVDFFFQAEDGIRFLVRSRGLGECV